MSTENNCEMKDIMQCEHTVKSNDSKNEWKTVSEDFWKSRDFMIHEFDNSYNQLNKSDDRLVDMFKTTFILFQLLSGLELGAYKWGQSLNPKIDYSLGASALLFVTGLMGIIFIAYIFNSRVYFVQTARYLNEMRDLTLKSIKFDNKSKIWTESYQPKTYGIFSTHYIFIVLLSFFNAIYWGLAFYIYFNVNNDLIFSIIEVCIVLFLVQAIIAHLSLVRRDQPILDYFKSLIRKR